MKHEWYQCRPAIVSGGIAAVLLFTICSSAAAQERVFGIFNDRLTELDTAPGRLGRPIVSIPFNQRGTRLFPVAGGRFLAYTRFVPGGEIPTAVTELVDLRTGQITQVLPGVNALIVATDPRVPRLYLRNFDQVIVADLTQMTTRSFTLVDGGFPPAVAYSPTGPLVVQLASNGITVLDVTTGATRNFPTVPVLGGSFGDGLVVDETGSRAYLTTGEGIFAYDLASGALLATNTVLRRPEGPRFESRLDPLRNRLLVLHEVTHLDPIPALVGVLNAETLAVEATVPLPTLAGLPQPVPFRPFLTPAQFEYSARRDTLYLAASLIILSFTAGSPEPQPCHVASLSRLNAATGATIERSDVTTLARATNGFARSPCYDALTVVRAPERPAASSTVVSNTVDISWTDPGNATHFEVEAGTAPGLRDITVFRVAGTRLLVPGVPPGRYHVRVHAINDVGRSLPSNELTIVVQ